MFMVFDGWLLADGPDGSARGNGADRGGTWGNVIPERG